MAVRHFLVAVLLVLFFSISSAPCNAKVPTVQTYATKHLDALQALWNDWNKSTPHAESNLAGWNFTQRFPCNQFITGDKPNWRGVECLTNIECKSTETDETCSAFIIGLTLNSASIVGTLPPDIGNISTLTTLELTGNKKLTGLLPDTLGNTQLITLDIRDNDFYGEFPDFGDFEWPQTLIISGNRFSGIFPLSQLRTMQYLQTLSLEKNEFEGVIDPHAFQDKKQLVNLDLSDNKFNGALPNFSTINYLQHLDVSNNTFIGSLPDLTKMLSLLTADFSSNRLNGTIPSLTLITSIQHLNLSRNAFTGTVVLSPRGTNSSLSVVDLSYNQLTGSIDFWNDFGLHSLQELYLDVNYLTGTLNITKLAELGVLRAKSANSSGMLRVVSLMNNNISDIVYDQVDIEELATIFRLQGNPYCISPDANDGTRCFCKQICFNSASLQNQDNHKVIAIVVGTVVSCLLILLIILVALYRYNRRYQRYLELQVKERFNEAEVKPTIFPFQQLKTATRDFHPDTKLGEGAYGAVYKGVLLNGSEVAVKQLFAKTTQDIDDFLNEVVMLTGMKHRNLMNLKGCCVREQQRLLVYEYVDNHDIDYVLLTGKQKALLTWPVRKRILLGVARGLHYLHALAHPKIIHRDIKASNILLTQNYEAKIADFGLALLFPGEESYIMTKHVAGTQGYMAPEYASYGQLSDKVDVFSFGILCLEVVSGRRNIDHEALPNQTYLSKLAWEVHREGRLMEVIDSTLSLQADEIPEVERVINIALLCIQNAAEQRPSMERVVAMLQGGTAAEVAAPQASHEEAYLENIRLFAMGKGSTLATVKEEVLGESSSSSLSRKSFKKSSMKSGFDDLSTGALLELSEIKVR